MRVIMRKSYDAHYDMILSLSYKKIIILRIHIKFNAITNLMRHKIELIRIIDVSTYTIILRYKENSSIRLFIIKNSRKMKITSYCTTNIKYKSCIIVNKEKTWMIRLQRCICISSHVCTEREFSCVTMKERIFDRIYRSSSGNERNHAYDYITWIIKWRMLYGYMIDHFIELR